jgi:S-adenosyl-L-homocysteine hydrolase, NAD binding domain
MEKKLKIVFLDRITAGPIKLKERFSKYGEYIEYDDTSPEQIVERISDTDVIITNRIKLRKEHFEKASKLKLVLITATGFNHIDIEGGNEKGIKTDNVSDYSTNSVAQLTMTYLLNELTPITEYSKEVKANKWLDITIPEFQSYPINDSEGKILGIVGFGNIGKKVAVMAETLGMKVMVAKIPGRKYDENNSKNTHEIRYELDEVLEKCDVLTLHTPLSELTRDLINLERMKKMKKSSIILNLARGPVINQEDLYFALKNKIIKSAAIDVTSVEPVEKDSKLFELENLLITPHIAWKSEKSLIRLMDNVENNLKMFLEGKLEGLK